MERIKAMGPEKIAPLAIFLASHMLPALRPSLYPLDRSGDVFSWDPI